jgi:epoxyqueuosine reductase QueG
MNQGEFAGLLDELSLSGWGIADVSSFVEARGFPRAVSLFKAYGLPGEHDPLRGGEYDEAALHDAILEARRVTEGAVEEIRAYLEARDIRHWIPAAGGQDPVTLTAEFSQKLAATRAGLGWVGRNSLFVTGEYGPRVRLMTVLVDCDLPTAEPETESGCGVCSTCVDACPYGYIKGADWRPGLPRDNLLDAFGCNSTLEELGVPLGRKHGCGRCLLACPFGA